MTPEVEDRISEAYDNLHELGVIHGDIQPHHVLVLRDGSIRIIDFDNSYIAPIDSELVEYENEEIENMFNGLKGYKHSVWGD